MLNRSALLVVAGAAIFALDASAVSAQDTTRARPTSTKRIPIAKESPGEVTIVRVDTVTAYRTDTLRLPGRVDTVVTTRTITRIDTVSIPVPIPQVLQQIGGLYFGLAGGTSLPGSDFNDSDRPGWRVDGMIGVDPVGSPFGLRLTGGYARYQPHSYVASFLGNAQIMSATLDGKVRLMTVSPFSKRLQLYGIAGGTWNRFKDILENDRGQFSVGNTVFPNNVISNPDHGWHNGWGYNAGGGAEIGFGRTNLFVESRFSLFKGQNGNIAYVPVVVGMSWF